MSEKCKFCGAEFDFPSGEFECGTEPLPFGEANQGPRCYERQIAALEAEVKRWRTLCEQSHLLLTALVKHKAIVRDPKLDLWGCVNEHGIDLLTALTEAK